MSILDRVNRRKEAVSGQTAPAVTPQPTPDTASPVPQPEQTPPFVTPKSASQMLREDAAQSLNKGMNDVSFNGLDWRSLDYDTAVSRMPNLSRSQYLSGAAQYRKENNLPQMTEGEIYRTLAGKDPFVSAKEEQEREKGFRRAERINAIGNVLANLVNYMRTKNGSPAMNLQPLSAGQQRIDKLKAYHDSLSRSSAASYLSFLERQRAMEAARDAEERDYSRKLALEEYKRNSPLSKAQVKAAEQRIETERARQRNIDAGTDYYKLKAEGQRQENEFNPKKQQADLALIQAKTEATKQGKKGKRTFPKVNLTGNQGKSKSYDLNNEQDVVSFYNMLEKVREIPEESRPKSISQMREYILTTLGKKYENNSDEEYAENANGLGWGENDEDNNDEIDW